MGRTLMSVKVDYSAHGIYIVRDENREIVYIGVDKYIRTWSRYKQHYKRNDEFGNWLNDNKHSIEKFVDGLTKENAHRLEIEMINKHKPRFNIRGK